MSPTAKQDDTNGRRLFGTDGIRGTANEHPMTPELALPLGRAVTFVAGRGKKHVPRILIGKDTRISCYMLETAMAAGVCSMGGDVMLCGPIPTPAVAHLTGEHARRTRGSSSAPATTRTPTTASRSSPPTASSCPTRRRPRSSG